MILRRFHFPAVYVALLAVLCIPLAPQPAAAVDLAGYQEALQRAVERLSSGADPGDVAAELRAIEPVTLADGTTLQPDLSAVLVDLEANPPDVTAAEARLSSLLAALERAEEGVATGGSDPSATLGDILAREEFSEQEPEDDPGLIQRAWNAGRGFFADIFRPIFEWIDRLLGGGSNDGGTGFMDVVIMLAALAMIGGLIYWVVRTVRREVAPGVVTLPGEAAEATMTSAEARAEAERLVQQGAFRAALRALYLATLLRWEEAGRLRFDRSLTNREVLASAVSQGDATLTERLTPLVERFDRIWYGDLVCTEADYAAFSRLAADAWEPVS